MKGVSTHNVNGDKALITQVDINPTTIRSRGPLESLISILKYKVYDLLHSSLIVIRNNTYNSALHTCTC